MATNYEKLIARFKKADDAIVRALRREYPLESEVRCWIQHGQINPSVGTVIGHDGGEFAYLRVRLHSRKADVRSVPVSHIVGSHG